VAYNGLLKRERQEIHERIALVIEQLFHYRLPEFYETLAFHFKRGKSSLKAIDYLMKSGEKSLKRYAVEESHQYYKEAFDILSNKSDKSREEEGLLIDLLIKWALVFYYRGDFKGLTDLLRAHEELAQALDDKGKTGMFYAWLGFTLWFREEMRRSYQYLRKALELGEEIDDKQVIGYACTWLAYPCAELGLLEEAINFGERAQEVARLLPSDQYLFFKSLDGIAFTYVFGGESKKNNEIGRTLLDYGRSRSNIRCLVMGHFHMGHSYLAMGDFSSAIECYQRATEVSADPLYSQFPRFLLGISYVFNGQFLEAEDVLKEVESFSRNYGTEVYETIAHGLLGVVLIAKGHMARGLKMIEDMRQSSLGTGRKYYYATTEHILGKVYFQLVEREGPISLSTMVKNIGFLIKNVPFASKKAEAHFKKAIEVAKEIGAKGILGQAYLDLGLLHKSKNRNDQAKECFSEAIQIFKQCEVEVYLKQAKEALGSLE
jgi:tetratricopeptide (TPR) repeat protein